MISSHYICSALHLVALGTLVTLAAASSIPILSLPGSISQTFGRTLKLQEEIIGDGFYDAFNFQKFDDPTHGRVNYVDKDFAMKNNLTHASDTSFTMRADSKKTIKPKDGVRGRDSIRIASKQHYGDLVVVLDLTHMPTGCGTWPAFWTVTTTGQWPSGGEIDIIEGINNRTYNLASLHTTPGCDMKGMYPRVMSGKVNSDLCDAKVNNNQGCGVEFRKPASFGANFNSARGGWYAMSRSKEEGVNVWFWGRDDPSVPEQVRFGHKHVRTETWGIPEAMFTAENCDMDEHFGLHEIVFDLTFCGDWAGSNYASSGCPGRCEDFVDSNPKAFVNAYWEINSLRTYV
ncbi:hypothetical protein BDV93DRAFT_499233 [Ceratobasidium sp. AG-I]|nr:hypothetical protein BDV93DRAFT_499233 [Ceratobasidium sp. AG-I]